jgi:hypothetical protein
MAPAPYEPLYGAPRASLHALVFRFDDFAFAPALRALFAIAPTFDERPMYIAPGSHQRPLDLFERLPEIELAPDEHKPAWSAFEVIVRSLMSDDTLRTLVRGESSYGAIAYGYHASAPYDRVEEAIASRVTVLRLRSLRAAANAAHAPISEHARAAALRSLLEREGVDQAEQARLWALGQRQIPSACLDHPRFAHALYESLAPALPAYNAVDHRIAALLAQPPHLDTWIRSVSVNLLRDEFEPLLAAVRAHRTVSEDALWLRCLDAQGGEVRSGAWWWTVAQLGDAQRVASMLRSMNDPLEGVERLIALAKHSKEQLPSIVTHVQAVASTDARWRTMVRKSLAA